MGVVLSAFSLFTAYQILSPGKLVYAPESKMRPYPSCVYRRLYAYMMEMIATSFFFAYCVSNFECWFYCERGLTKPFTRVTIQHLQKKNEGVLYALLLPFFDHMFIISRHEFDHMCWLVCFLSALYVFLLCRRSKFRAHLPSENKTTYQSFGTWIWPHLWP